MKHSRPRHHCELCGKKLKFPELDYSKIAICPHCLKGQRSGLKELIGISHRTLPQKKLEKGFIHWFKRRVF